MSDVAPIVPAPRRVYWHRHLPPLDGDPVKDDVIEASSAPVPYSWAERDALWTRSYDGLVAAVEARLDEELTREGGRFAHIVDEEIRPVVDHAAGTYTLKGRFAWVLYR